MIDYIGEISDFIARRRVACELRIFEESCHSVEEACIPTGASPEEFIKSICFVSGNGLVVGIVRGCDRASTKRISKAVGLADVRMATPDEVLELTGYPVGGVPPFGYAATFLLDPNIFGLERVWAGGGSDRSLISIDPSEIARITGGTRIRIRK